MSIENRVETLEQAVRELRTDLTGVVEISFAVLKTAKAHMPDDAKAALEHVLETQMRRDWSEGAQSFADKLLQILHT